MLMQTSGKDGFNPFQPAKQIEKEEASQLIPPKLAPPPPMPVFNATQQKKPDAPQQ